MLPPYNSPLKRGAGGVFCHYVHTPYPLFLEGNHIRLKFRDIELNVDLDACGSGSQMLIEFETNEHKKSGFSFAGSIVPD